jgi:hypothetical protein
MNEYNFQNMIEAHAGSITKTLMQEREAWLRFKRAELGLTEDEFAERYELVISPPEMTHLHNMVWEISENLRLVRR